MKPGSTSIARQSLTHAPHWMQAIVCVMSTIDSLGTMCSRSGCGPSLISHGVTRCTFFQCTASMSTIMSLITGMLPIGSTSITPSLDDAHPAGAADRRAAGAADADRAVEPGLGLQDALQHRAVGLELDRVLVPVG